jgi:hypothetical protein
MYSRRVAQNQSAAKHSRAIPYEKSALTPAAKHSRASLYDNRLDPQPGLIEKRGLTLI